MMDKHINFIKLATVFLTIGVFSPSVKVAVEPDSTVCVVEFTLLHEALSGGMKVSGMHSGGGMHRSGMRSSGLGRSMMKPSPMHSRYQGGNFPTRRVSIPSKPKLRPVPVRPTSKPISHSSAVQKPAKPVRPSKPVRPDKPTKPIRPNQPNGGNNHHWHHPHHPHHGHHHHHYYHHYPYHGWGDYWTWFWGSSIVIGAIVSTIPENECSDITIDGKLYKECEGVLFEPVYQGDTVEYEVVEIEK